MTDESQTLGKQRPLVIVLGVFPPPVTGMTLCTERVTAALTARCNVKRIDLSSGSSSVTWFFRVVKFARLLPALMRLALSPSLRDAILYMPLNAGFAMYYNLAAALVARLRGWPTAIHHHAYLYLNRSDWRVRLLDRIIQPRGLHLLLCSDMRQRLVELYDAQANCAYVPSTITLTGGVRAPELTDRGRSVRRLGHISNLSQAKGVIVAIRTFAKLREEGCDVEMVVAGPITEPVVEREITWAKERFAESFDYRGPVYGTAKERFFEDIDVLLFPSRFRLEAQPIVLSEAFAYGKPALAFGISCIPSLVGNPEWHVCPQGDFVSFAGTLVKRWRKCPDEYAAARAAAYARVQSLVEDAKQSLAGLASWTCGEDAEGFLVN